MSDISHHLNFGSMTPVIYFLMELDKLKNVQRQTQVSISKRRENSAEHSWHFAMAALSLAPYASQDVDIQRVVKMALLHDIVEIDAGDVLVYDLAARDAIHEVELAAAKRLFGMLPQPQSDDFMAYWLEYDAGESADARFAGMLDRLLPLLSSLYNNGESWMANGIYLEQVLQRNSIIGQENPELWQHLRQHLDNAKEKGWLK